MSEEWKVVKEWIDDGDGSEVEIFHVFIGADQITDFPIDRNDAYIMAAAKDMLLALEAVVSVADRATVEFDMARAAIAKARDRL